MSRFAEPDCATRPRLGTDEDPKIVDHSTMTSHPVIAETRLRQRDQLTFHATVVEAGRLTEGERFAVVLDPAPPDTSELHRTRVSYAGALRGEYGDPVDALAEGRRGWP